MVKGKGEKGSGKSDDFVEEGQVGERAFMEDKCLFREINGLLGEQMGDRRALSLLECSAYFLSSSLQKIRAGRDLLWTSELFGETLLLGR